MPERKWDFEQEETSDGFKFTVYDEHGDGLTTPYIAEKDARLIAAAPRLLKASKKYLKALRVAMTEAELDNYEDELKMAIAVAEAA